MRLSEHYYCPHSVFWHQLIRQTLSDPARFITYDVVRLQKGRLAARYMCIFLTFLNSGLMHAGGELAAGVSWQQSGAIRFFCTQTVGIMLEDGVQAIYGSARGIDRSRTQPPIWARLIGYIWVITFLVWSTPVWTYPQIRINKGEEKDLVVPFSVIAPMRSAWQAVNHYV